MSNTDMTANAIIAQNIIDMPVVVDFSFPFAEQMSIPITIGAELSELSRD